VTADKRIVLVPSQRVIHLHQSADVVIVSAVELANLLALEAAIVARHYDLEFERSPAGISAEGQPNPSALSLAQKAIDAAYQAMGEALDRVGLTNEFVESVLIPKIDELEVF
jgi:hypothetical protein